MNKERSVCVTKKQESPAACTHAGFKDRLIHIGLTVMVAATALPIVCGITSGIFFLAACAAAYSVYKAILQAGKKKHANKIVSVSSEHLNENR